MNTLLLARSNLSLESCLQLQHSSCCIEICISCRYIHRPDTSARIRISDISPYCIDMTVTYVRPMYVTAILAKMVESALVYRTAHSTVSARKDM